MKSFTPITFNIPTLAGISTKAIEEHLKLYAGYVKHSNIILEKIQEYSVDTEKHAYALGELQRRFAFEFDGMRNHEYYFKSLEGGAQTLAETSPFKKAIVEEWGSFDAWINRFKAIALTRGIGWAILYYDPATNRLVHTWSDEQHLGHLTGLQWILGIDMWEHAYLFDYIPADKKKYVEAFFENLNWNVIEKNFSSATHLE